MLSGAGAHSSQGIWWPLLLSTLAGLSTSIGGVIAINLSPDEATLAFLLGSAIGVMSTVSVVELWLRKAVEHGAPLGITGAVLCGAALFAVLDPLLPKPVEPQQLLQERGGLEEEQECMVKVHLDSKPQVTVATSVKRQSFAPRQGGLKLASADSTAGTGLSSSGSAGLAALAATVSHSGGSSANSSSSGSAGKAGLQSGGSGPLKQSKQAGSHHQQQGDVGCDGSGTPADQQQLLAGRGGGGGGGGGGGSSASASGGSSNGGVQAQLQLLRAHHAGLMRLGLLMALTMTLHNMPEGFAVAFSAFTSVGPMMCGAIAMHNIPEGLIIAAPIYAASGSKAKALAITTASGLSEPLGALVALFVARPFITSIQRLDFVLATVGGIMLSVCALELFPEARRCRQDTRMVQGIALGAVLMGWTLYVGV